MKPNRSPIEVERSRRIRLAIAAYAYEYEDDPIMSDADYDALALLIEPNVKTGNKNLDRFFMNQFSHHTGSWVRKHPDIDKLKKLYDMIVKNREPK